VTSYLVVSPRIGVPGAPFHPSAGVNVAALLASGAIVAVEEIIGATAKDAAQSITSRKVTRKTPKE
jgi:hypothetical protein